MSRPTKTNRKQRPKVACTRCGRWVEDDVRRQPPFCRDCRYADPWFYARIKGEK